MSDARAAIRGARCAAIVPGLALTFIHDVDAVAAHGGVIAALAVGADSDRLHRSTMPAAEVSPTGCLTTSLPLVRFGRDTPVVRCSAAVPSTATKARTAPVPQTGKLELERVSSVR